MNVFKTDLKTNMGHILKFDNILGISPQSKMFSNVGSDSSDDDFVEISLNI